MTKKFLITKFDCSMYIRVCQGGNQGVSTCKSVILDLDKLKYKIVPLAPSNVHATKF